ncbi:HvfC/BufC family peptide modification chaperone [Lysobacter sp. CA196]|uniref:HvfC/BufC family peptide modification chaperone n=1 Tax=Lysobacter sp. CA196 TaxID=3455606 RepID=UPI003F8D0999
MPGEPDDVVDGRISRKARLRMYRHAYVARLTEVLNDDHAVLGAYLGDELWPRMRASHIDAHPSGYCSLPNFGTSLPTYLAQVEPFSSYDELAEFERFLHRQSRSFQCGACLVDQPGRARC